MAWSRPLGVRRGCFVRAITDEAIRAHAGQTASLVSIAHRLLACAARRPRARHRSAVHHLEHRCIGILASEALLRAAQRGVAARDVDDLLIDAPDATLLALAAHPNVDIRIYNPVHSVGVPWYRRLWSAVTDFRGSNQRMHDKVLIVDGELAVAGGRNMADEYFDYNQAYNFRDRDALVMGAVVPSMRDSFERFWASDLAVPVEDLLANGAEAQLSAEAVESTYRELSAYAADGANFEPEVRAAIAAVPDDFSRLAGRLVWGQVDFVSDLPGKNSGAHGLGGGGLSSAALAALVASAEDEVVIQSPYLVASEPALRCSRTCALAACESVSARTRWRQRTT
jgi:putative cardiolipin synthase